MSVIRYTKHAQQRMDERGIGNANVLAVLNSGIAKPCEDKPNRLVYTLEGMKVITVPHGVYEYVVTTYGM